MKETEITLINESIKPLIRQIRNIDDRDLRQALCESLLEMCDELIARGKREDNRI